VLGNTVFAGYVWSMLGMGQAEDQFDFDQHKIKPLMKQFKMSPWSAVTDLKLLKRRVQMLVQHNRIAKIDVEIAKQHYEQSIGGWLPQHRLSRSLFMKETNKLVQTDGKFLSAQDYEVLDDVFSLLDVDKSEELEAPEWALGLRLIFAGDEKKKLQMAFEMIDRDNDGTISKKEIHRFLMPYMNIIVPTGAEVLRPLLAWHCAELCMQDVAAHMQKDKDIEEAPLEDFVSFCEKRDIVLEAAERIDKKVYEIWLELEHESVFFARKDARKQAGAVRRTMSEMPTARRSRQDSGIFLDAVTDPTNFVMDSCVSTCVSMPQTSVEACNAASPRSNSAEIPKFQEGQSSNDRIEVGALPLPAPPPPAAQLKSTAADTEQPRQTAIADVPRGSVVPKLQMAQPTTFAQMVQPTAFALRSSRPCHFSSPHVQTSPGVASSSALSWTHRSSTVVQYGPADAPQVHTLMASPRLLSKASSHVSAVSTNPPSRGVSFQATPRSLSMQSCKSTISSAPLPHLLGVHRHQSEVKSKLLE
jgi:hypothetical protein